MNINDDGACVRMTIVNAEERIVPEFIDKSVIEWLAATYCYLLETHAFTHRDSG